VHPFLLGLPLINNTFILPTSSFNEHHPIRFVSEYDYFSFFHTKPIFQKIQ